MTFPLRAKLIFLTRGLNEDTQITHKRQTLQGVRPTGIRSELRLELRE